MEKRIDRIFTSVWILALPMIFLAACGSPPSAAVKSVDAGATWEVNETTSLAELTIAEGSVIAAPEGRSLTMTVDGVETPIKPGAYKGDIVLTPAADILVNFNGMGMQKTYYYRAAIYVDEGGYSSEKSVSAAAVGGEVTDASATDVKITSVGEKFNGIMVTGESKKTYRIVNPDIRLSGNGFNDFAGFGAAIMSDGKAEVTVENARINNTGVVRTAIWAGGESTMTVNNSDIEVYNGTLPEDYSWSWVRGGGGELGHVMMEVPWMLGLTGNNRATTVVGNASAYYNNTHIRAQAWGALSTDQVGADSKLVATGCHIEAVESGYGTFGDGSANTYSGCTFDVADYGMILCYGSAHFTDGCVVNSGRFGVTSYKGSGVLVIDGGSVFNTKKAAIQVKSGTPSITVDNAVLNPGNGLILQAMVNDDPHSGGASAGARGGGMPEEGMAAGKGGNEAVSAIFRNMTLTGDIVTSMTSEADLAVSFENATITGAITTATAEHAVGPNGETLVMQDETDLHYLIGEVTETYCATGDAYGMKVSVDGTSRWVIDETSYLTGLTLAEGAEVTAPDGARLIMTVNGVTTPIKAGVYTGRIELRVAPDA